MFKILSEIYLGKAKPSSGGGGGGLPSQTGHSGQFLTTDGTTASWGDVNTSLPAFPAPHMESEDIPYTTMGGKGAIEGKTFQLLQFNDLPGEGETVYDHTPDLLRNVSGFTGSKHLYFYKGDGSSYDSSTDILYDFEFYVTDGVLTACNVNITYPDETWSVFGIIGDFGYGVTYCPWDTYLSDIFWQSQDQKWYLTGNFKVHNIDEIVYFKDNKLVFETEPQEVDSLPAASSYTNKLCYVYEIDTTSDIRNLIYSDGTNWSLLPGTILMLPAERMYDIIFYDGMPKYCGITLAHGQLAIPCYNKVDTGYNSHYAKGKVHYLNLNIYNNEINKNWEEVFTGTVFASSFQYLQQTAPEEGQEQETAYLEPYTEYGKMTFYNDGQDTLVQKVNVKLVGWSTNPVYFYAHFTKGTNKIQLNFQNNEYSLITLNGETVSQSSITLDADSKDYIAYFYKRNDNPHQYLDGDGNTVTMYGEIVMDIRELPYSSSAQTQVVDLGSVSTTTALSTNTNYTATLNGSATFTLPTPSDTSIENTINLLLNVSSSTTVDWGVNANSVLTSFDAGKYELRLRYNNNTSNWIGEVLKQEATPSHTKCFVSFDETYTDQTGNITLTPNFTPTYTDNAGYTAFEGVKSLQTATGSLDKGFTISDPNNVLTFDGTFTIALWVRIGSSTRNTAVFSGGTSNLRLEGTGTLTLASQTISGSTYLTNSMHYVEINRDSENKVRYFIDGILQNVSNLKTISGTVKFSDSTLCFSSSMDASHCFQDFVITDQVGHTVNYDVPTAPYVISDNSLADLHDSIKQNNLTTITGYDSSKTQVLKNVQGVLTWVDEA